MREAVVVEAVRTPVGKRNGGLAAVHAADLSAGVLTELAERSGIDFRWVTRYIRTRLTSSG